MSPSEAERTETKPRICTSCRQAIDVPIAIGASKRHGGCGSNYPGSDYDADEVEFIRAMSNYKETHRRPHPTCADILAVVRSLGYRKPVL